MKQLRNLFLQNDSARERLLLGLLVGYAALRLFCVSTLPLIGAEAYYWEWSKNLSWGYFDHPPMIAGLLALSTGIGGDSVFFVRLVPAILSVLSTIVLYRLAKEMFGSLTALLACAIVQFIPFFAAVSVLATPDAPLAFFWILTVYCVHRATQTTREQTTGEQTENHTTRWWLAAGVALGLDLMSKYHSVLLMPSVFLYVLVVPRQRSWLLRKEPYLALAVAFLVFSPNLLWNLSRHLQTFEFLLVERQGTPEISFGHILHFFGGILALLSPFFALLLLGLVPSLARKAREDARYALLLATSLVPVVFFGVLSPFVSIGGHWPAVGYTTFCLLGIAALREAGPAPFGRLRQRIPLGSIGFSFVLVFTLYSVLVLLVQIPSLGAPGAGTAEDKSQRLSAFSNLRRELLGWQQLGAEVDRAIAAMPDPTHTFVITDTYRLASQIRFLTHSKYPTQVTGIAAPHQYALWRDRIDLTGWDAIAVSKKSRIKNSRILETIFTRVDPIQDHPITHDGTPVRSFYFQPCYTAKLTPGLHDLSGIASQPSREKQDDDGATPGVRASTTSGLAHEQDAAPSAPDSSRDAQGPQP